MFETLLMINPVLVHEILSRFPFNINYFSTNELAKKPLLQNAGEVFLSVKLLAMLPLHFEQIVQIFRAAFSLRPSTPAQ